jgi:UDP-GlcNAc:undecaprenyl-phosphate/decaprenyl-phosphate GlcNAc-1-phosphate transferase
VSTRAIRSAIVGAAAARLSYSLLRARPPGGAAKWTRTNHRGEPVTLLEGPAVAIGGVAGALAAGGPARDQLAMAIAGAGAAAFGGYDDLAGNADSKGFRGHLGALRKGELTTGAVKLAGIGAVGLAAAVIADGSGDGTADRIVGRRAVTAALADTLINAGLIAGGANLLNLFDLRPGRAAKVALIAGGLLAPAGASASAAPLAAAAALLPEDLGERAMLGDAGANALGAMLGTAAATSLSRPARLAALGVIAGLTASSEVVSFTKIIERTGPLRWLDMLGRRPAPAAQAPATGQQAPAPPAPGPHAPAGSAQDGAATVPAPGASAARAGATPASATPASATPAGASPVSTAAGNGTSAGSVSGADNPGARDGVAGPAVGKHRAGTRPSAEGR